MADSDGHTGTISGSSKGAVASFTQSISHGEIGNKAFVFRNPTPTAPSGIRIANMSGFTQFKSGSGGAQPIIRGVLLAPSGVILHLSGNQTAATSAPATNVTAATSDPIRMGRKGAITGSVSTATGEFVMLLNGYKGDPNEQEKITHITASFDTLASNYFPRVLNKDPLKIEEKGHLLYSYYDIHPNYATITGSGIINAGYRNLGSSTADTQEDIGFLLSSSILREATSFGNVPVYEDFEDRFTHAESPFLITQKFGNQPYDLFKVVALSAGEGPAQKYKISIKDLKRSTSDTNKYGSFTLLVRDFNDTDEEPKVLETFSGLSLDPGSSNYVGRVIGDQNIFYNFDAETESQKIVVDGTHPVRSRFIRIQLSTNLKRKNVPDEALPLGFRGPKHLVTSGGMLATETHNVYATNILKRVTEIPFLYRENIAVGTGQKRRDDARFYWGVQSTAKRLTAQPNKSNVIDQSLFGFTKYFPTHRKDTTAISLGENVGAAKINGSVVDCDLFNKNQFSLENIRVRTGSDGVNDTTSTWARENEWVSASYVRGGNISVDSTKPASSATGVGQTRAFSITDLDKSGNRRFAKFTLVLQGGFDGTNIFNKDKLKIKNAAAKREIDDSTEQGGTGGPTVAAYRKAVDIMGSKTDTDIQLLAIPGMRHTSISDYAISAVENRFDALYLMDIEERDQQNNVVTASSAAVPHVLNTINQFKDRVLDTSFAAAYFPDVTVRDPETGTFIQVPPSVAVLGAFSLNDKIGHPWFAPAGFTRGALNSVELAAVRLNKTNLDDLYNSDINPIARHPGQGLTVWGQKTLLQSQSALDRINVRRLLISIRRSVRRIADSLLFEPNRTETLEKFSSLVNPLLQRVQELGGVDRYKVVIDTSTTTQADVENNTIRGKIYLQPTRAIEFISLDFVVTNSGTEI